jgi:hypothetical protein
MKKVALNLKNKSIGDLIIFAKKVHDGMAGNAATFTAPVPTMVELLALITTLETTQQDTILGGKAARVLRDIAYEQLVDALVSLGTYVQFVSAGAEDVINLAGMDVAINGPRKYPTIEMPYGVEAFITSNPGEILVKWKRPHRVVTNFEVQYCLDAITDAGWRTFDFTKATKLVVKNLPGGKKAFFRVRGFSAAGKSEWSQPAVQQIW